MTTCRTGAGYFLGAIEPPREGDHVTVRARRDAICDLRFRGRYERRAAEPFRVKERHDNDEQPRLEPSEPRGAA